MEIVIHLAAAVAAYFLGTILIELGESVLLVGISFLVALYFVVRGMVDIWTEIEAARTENTE